MTPRINQGLEYIESLGGLDGVVEQLGLSITWERLKGQGGTAGINSSFGWAVRKRGEQEPFYGITGTGKSDASRMAALVDAALIALGRE